MELNLLRVYKSKLMKKFFKKITKGLLDEYGMIP